nr:aminoglycoside phosphotransferase family protein [Halomarina salina]
MDDERVLKLFVDGVVPDKAEREMENTRVAHGAGAPAPAVHETRTVDGRVGIVLDRLDGPTLLDSLAERSWRVARVGRRLAEVQAGVHDCDGAGLPGQRERLRRDVAGGPLPGDTRDEVLSVLDDLPRGHAACHGDCHPGNVLQTPRPVVVDWLDATCGHPLADVARTTLLLRVAGVPSGVRGVPQRSVRRALLASYRRRYAEVTGRSLDDERWLLVAAAARLAEDVPGERSRLLSLVRELLDGR